MNNKERINFLDTKVEELGEQQANDLVIDYDAALKEYKQKSNPYKIKFKGRIFDVPRSMPFSFSMFYMRYCLVKKQGKTIFQIPDERIHEFIEKMFGRLFLKTLMNSDDVDMNFVMGTLVPDIFEKWGYGINTPRKDDLGKNVQTPDS